MPATPTSTESQAMPGAPTPETIITTLFELCEALQEAAAPGEEALVTAAVLDLLQSGRLTFLGPVAEDDLEAGEVSDGMAVAAL